MLPAMMYRRTFQMCSWGGASMGGGPAGHVGSWIGWDVSYGQMFGHAVCEPVEPGDEADEDYGDCDFREDVNL